MNFIRNIILLLFVFGSFTAAAQNIPPRPNPPRLVNDIAGVLSPDEEASLERKLVAYDDSTSNQIAVVLIRTLNDYPIEEYALSILRTWGVGNKNTNNGVVIVAAIDDRQIRIETGYGLEGAIPDITASQIIRNDIAPSFRSENYFEGLSKASESIIQAAAGEYKAPEGYGDRGKTKGGKGLGSMIIIFIIIIFILSNINRRGGGGGGMMSRRGYRGGLAEAIILGSLFGGGRSSGGGGFGGGFGGGGGGFGGFGGGSGGGGGASGSW